MIFMVGMNRVHLRDVDLNLLVVLEDLLVTRSTTATARRLGRTQSAVSHALARLRRTLGDPLFVRAGPVLEPTAMAEALRPQLARALGEVAAVFRGGEAFDPATHVATVRIVAADFAEIVLLPRVLARLEREAPGIDLHVGFAGDDTERVVREGAADLALGAGMANDGGLLREELYTDRFLGIARRGSAFAKRPALATYAKAAHVLVSPRGRPGSFVDDALSKLGYQRRIHFTTPHFATAAHVVAESDAVCTMPARLARVFAERLPLSTFEVPFALPTVAVASVFRAARAREPLLGWFRRVLQEAV
jgi:DNA-binding transcriptional LysR family regulator